MPVKIRKHNVLFFVFPKGKKSRHVNRAGVSRGWAGWANYVSLYLALSGPSWVSFAGSLPGEIAPFVGRCFGM